MTDLIKMGKVAKAASRELLKLTTDQKNEALLAIADELESQAALILEQNSLDIKDGKAKGLSSGILDRLLLTPERITKLANDCRKVATLPDPVGAAIESRSMPNGLQLTRRRVPIGVIGVIYEARPNVTIDIATLTLKTSNASILRGGKETLRSNLAMVGVIQAALEKCGIPAGAVQYIDNPDRALVAQFMKLDQYIDMLIPRGGHALHKLCREEATIPVITGGIGICHVVVDESADFEDALNIIENSKVQRPSVCNALDTILVHSTVAEAFIPQAAQRMASNKVSLKADPRAISILDKNGHDAVYEAAGENDWDTEWMDLILGIKVIDSLDEAIDHIAAHSLEHSDSIVTNNWSNAMKFVNEVNSSAVFVNASTRFNDGGEFGLGAEVAVSTQKLHARGPLGLEELTTYKWVVFGEGHIRP